MAVEIVFSNEMSRDMDPETAVLTSDLTRGFSKSLQADVIRARTPFQSRSEFSGFFIKYYDGRLFFFYCTSNIGVRGQAVNLYKLGLFESSHPVFCDYMTVASCYNKALTTLARE